MSKKIEFLKKYVNTPSPSGYEMLLGGQKVWIDYVSQFCEKVEVDLYGNAYAHYNEMKADVKTILIDAHCDEIGFLVFDITDTGFIKIARLGGSDISIVPSTRVNIWGEKGVGLLLFAPDDFTGRKSTWCTIGINLLDSIIEK